MHGKIMLFDAALIVRKHNAGSYTEQTMILDW